MGQMLLAYFAWKSFAYYITASMEVSPVTYKTYEMVFVARDVHGLSLICLIWEFCHTNRRLPSKVAMAFMSINMAFILAFPTMASAMTGYQQNAKAYVPDLTGNYVPFSSAVQVLFIIHDGQRVGLSRDYPD